MDYITRKSLLYKTGVEYGDYTINHIEGCAHGCNYPCYAMLMAKRFSRIKTYREWLKPKIVANSIELLQNEIPRLKDKIKSVHLCFMSDPFMLGYPEIHKMSLKIIELLNANGIMVTTLTKGIYPENLLGYGTIAANEYGISLVSIDAGYQKSYEPGSAKWFQRIRSLEKLHDSGAKTWASMEPYPTPNIIKQNIGKILDKISFVDKIIFGKLNYNVKSTQYPDNKEFCKDQCRIVIDFCRSNGIAYHIKKGTLAEVIPPVCVIRQTPRVLAKFARSFK